MAVFSVRPAWQPCLSLARPCVGKGTGRGEVQVPLRCGGGRWQEASLSSCGGWSVRVWSGVLRFRTGSFHGAEKGGVSPLIHSMKLKIQEQLEAEDVVVVDANGDGRHVSIDVVAAAFEGQNRVNRQRMVYKAIWEELQGAVHAVDQLTTKTPAEAAAAAKANP